MRTDLHARLRSILPLVTTFVRHKIVYLAVGAAPLFPPKKVIKERRGQLVWQWIKEEAKQFTSNLRIIAHPHADQDD